MANSFYLSYHREGSEGSFRKDPNKDMETARLDILREELEALDTGQLMARVETITSADGCAVWARVVAVRIIDARCSIGKDSEDKDRITGVKVWISGKWHTIYPR